MTSSKKDGGWGIGITILYGSFVVFILSIVAFASFQSFHLVDKDYYPRELKYQEQIEKIARGKASITSPPVYDHENKSLRLKFENIPSSSRPAGEIVFFRPSNPNLDFIREISPDSNGIQVIDLKDAAAGMWRIKISWSVDKIEYYYEDLLVIE